MHKLFQESLQCFSAPLRELPPKPPRPTNVVYTVYLERTQDLTLLPNICLNTKRNDSHFASTNVKTVSPSTTVLLFQPGKLVCVGAMVPNIGLYSLVETRLLLLRQGALAAFRRPNISNIVMSGNAGFFIDLANFVADNEHKCNYVPKVFSGCSFSPSGLNLDLLGEKNDAEVPAEERKKKKKAVIFEGKRERGQTIGGAINFMGLRSYEEGFELSVETLEALRPYAKEPRENKGGLVDARVRELEAARKRRTNEPKKQKLSTETTPLIVY